MNKIVLKLGTGILTGDDGEFAKDRLSRILDQVLPALGTSQLVIVSSGAVGLGRSRLQLNGDISLHQKQMCAAVGQALLMQHYNMMLANYNFTAAQVLVTSDDFISGVHRKNLLATLKEMEGQAIVPIINENDTISTEELEELKDHSFGDNDKLSSLIAIEIKAQLLLIFTDIPGVFKSRKDYEQGKYLKWVPDINELNNIETWSSSQHGRGGIISKIEAARLVVENNIPCWIASGKDKVLVAEGLKAIEDKRVPHQGTFITGGRLSWKL